MRRLRIVIDYRPALRARTGVGEYVHQLARAWSEVFPADDLTLFTSSWKDRPDPAAARELRPARMCDWRVPVSALNYAWHNLQTPPVEWLTRRRCDVAFSPHPLLTPARRAARIVMVHDLDFLLHPERTVREIRRDYPRLAAVHARRADRVVVPSSHTAREVIRLLGVSPARVAVCQPGLPQWTQTTRGFDPHGYLLFLGSLEPRKNVMGLLAAYARVIADGSPAMPLVMAGGDGADGDRVRAALARPSLRRRVTHLGYIAAEERQRLYAGARAVVLPSFDEGFGMPVLEAMSLGIPVIASSRGALPELVADSGLLIDPEDERALAGAIARLSADDALARTLSRRGLFRAAQFSWQHTARAIRVVCESAIQSRRCEAQTKETAPFQSIADTSSLR